MKKNNYDETENRQETVCEKKKLIHRLKTRRFWDRLAGFAIVLVLVVGCGLLGLE